jgi:succinyl-diaminopimelate desuccinylase
LITSLSPLDDPLPIAQALIRCPSVTPKDAGAQDVLAEALARLGFHIVRLPFGQVANLYARIGSERPHFCFAGHTDVVPAGNAPWTVDPFGGEVRDDVLYGRGACDMKGAVAAFVAGVAQFLGSERLRGSISLLITGDEEGEAVDGTAKVLDWMRAHQERPDFCLVGEPTNPKRLGEVVKIGRRGSLNAKIRVFGRQGHTAYPHLADNPLHRLVAALAALTAVPLDAGTEWFEPSTLQLTSIDVGNPAANVIPATAEARLNIRFNPHHSGESLTAWLRAAIGRFAEQAEVDVYLTGEPFLTTPGPEVQRLCQAIAAETGFPPRLETGGGTSDARFIAGFCPVAEFGLVGATIHAADECVPLAELRMLARIYRRLLHAFLS